MEPISKLANIHTGLPAYCVGMGPTLLQLTPKHFPRPGIVIASYESIVMVEPWFNSLAYSLQKDDILVLPDHSPLILHRTESLRDWKGYEPTYVFDSAIDLMGAPNSGACMVGLALLMGCRDITCLCFDRCTQGWSHRARLNARGVWEIDPRRDPYLYSQSFELSLLTKLYGADLNFVTPT